MKRTSTYRTLLVAVMAGLAVLALPGCGTTGTNRMAMEAYGEALVTQRAAAEQHANACATTAASCADDMCRVAVMLACGQNQPDRHVPQPQLRSAGEEFARAFSPVASLLNTGLQVWGAGWLVDRSGQNMVDLVGAVGGVAGQLQGPVDNSISIGGDQIGGDRIDDESVGGDRIGGDNRVGDDIGGDQIGGDNRVGDETRDSCIGPDCRNSSAGPIDQSDNSDNSDSGGDDGDDPPAPPEDDP